MATGAAFGIIAKGIAAAGAAYTAYSTHQTAKYNEKVAEQQAQQVTAKAKYDADLHRQRVQRLLSKQRALYGKSGVEMSGSPLLVMEDTIEQGEIDALAIQYGGDVESARARSQANLYKMQGRSAIVGGAARSGGTLLSGYAQYKMGQ